ncbi:hypothetical protein ACT4VQ_09350 [Acinetobacter baumannii]|nr:hypothetical protein [Acinetobacter pittii]MCE6626820.1 hypothetical protein [Acinetobacter pittii]MCH2051860.1 hypothetical protein [Acinetobacter pittii]MDV8151053.1 hypothetical protein [Acinetobacter pittii]
MGNNPSSSNDKPERPPKVDGPNITISQNSWDKPQRGDLNISIKVPDKK